MKHKHRQTNRLSVQSSVNHIAHHKLSSFITIIEKKKRNLIHDHHYFSRTRASTPFIDYHGRSLTNHYITQQKSIYESNNDANPFELFSMHMQRASSILLCAIRIK